MEDGRGLSVCAGLGCAEQLHINKDDDGLLGTESRFASMDGRAVIPTFCDTKSALVSLSMTWVMMKLNVFSSPNFDLLIPVARLPESDFVIRVLIRSSLTLRLVSSL